jgi:cytochrome c biogenesis protein CcmG/thiol:disulfide interchange protein DsbE
MLSTSAVIGSAAPQANHYAPDIALTDLSGKPVQLSSLRGEVVMLAFWSTSCSTCQSDLQALERAYQQEQASGFVVVGLDASDNGPSATTYAKHAGMTYPIFVDDSGRDTAIYHVTKTPYSFLIDRFGVIRAIFIGPVNNATLARDLAQLLREK